MESAGYELIRSFTWADFEDILKISESLWSLRTMSFVAQVRLCAYGEQL